MMSIGDSMLNHAGWLDERILQVTSPAVATPMICGKTMINNTGKIQIHRTARLLMASTQMDAAKVMPCTTPAIAAKNTTD